MAHFIHRSVWKVDSPNFALKDLPVVVEAVGSRERIEAALPTVREVLRRGLITLTDVELYAREL